MSSIDPNSILQAYLREHARVQKTRGTVPVESRAQAPQAANVEEASPLPSLQQTLVAKVAAISRDDPQAKRKAFRCFLEFTLKQQLGRSIGLDPGFSTLVERVHTAMEQDPSLQTPLDKAGQLLLKTHTTSLKRR